MILLRNALHPLLRRLHGDGVGRCDATHSFFVPLSQDLGDAHVGHDRVQHRSVRDDWRVRMVQQRSVTPDYGRRIMCSMCRATAVHDRKLCDLFQMDVKLFQIYFKIYCIFKMAKKNFSRRLRKRRSRQTNRKKYGGDTSESTIKYALTKKYGVKESEAETLLTNLTMIVTHINTESNNKDYKNPHDFIMSLVDGFSSKESLMAFITSIKQYF